MNDKKGLSKNVGVWIRVSSDEQAKNDSPTHHIERAKNYAALRGWNIVEFYDLAGVSGKSVIAHPECQRMLADVKRGHISGLIFSKLARLARNTIELLEFSKFFERNNADLISIAETIDTSTPAGRLFFTIIAGMATWEREETGERQRASILVRAKLGKTINGQAPYGYVWKDRELKVNPDEAPIRRRAYELFLQYRRKGTVAKILNSEGCRTRSGANFSDTQVRRILICSSARGVYIFNRMRKTGTWAATAKPESEWGVANCDPIVPVEVWDQVNKILEEQSKQWKRPGKMPVNPFGNRIWCQCGQRMYERKAIGKFFCRACRRKIPVQGLEDFIREELHDFYGSPQQVAIRRDDAQKHLTEREEAFNALQKQAQKIRDEMKKTHQLLMDGHITPQGFGDFYKPAEERLGQLLAGLPKLEAELAYLKGKQASTEEILLEAKTLYEEWPKLNSDRKRVIVESVFERIEVKDAENGGVKLRIIYSGLPSSEEMCKNQQLMAPATC